MTPSHHVIVGAGPVGTALAGELAGAGYTVRQVTRSGRGLDHPRVERVSLDATDAAALAATTEGAAAIYNCANPGTYAQWERLWPPLAAAILHAAESSGAVLVTTSNLYGYGPVDEPMSQDLPLRPSDHKGELRARMWRDALAAHDAGRVRATEARAADFIGPTCPPESTLLARFATTALAGKTTWVFADPDQPHAWTAVEDVARTLAVLGTDERAWGKPWIVPSNPAVSVREALGQLAAAVGAPEPKLRVVPRGLMRALGVAVPLLREVMGVLYQFDRPFHVDASATTATFGIEPTPWDELVARSAEAWRPGAR